MDGSYKIGDKLHGLEVVDRWKEGNKYYGMFECPYCGEWFEAPLYRVIQGYQLSCGCTKVHREDLVTAEMVRSKIAYEPDTGIFRAIKKLGDINPGDVLGTQHSLGYILITFDGFSLRAHRLAFLLMTGAWPSQVVDHINGDKEDNRWDNLRDVSISINTHNSGTPSTNHSGYKGVYWSKTLHKWRAYMGIGRSRKWVYYGDSKIEAINARNKAEQCLIK